MRAYSFVRNQLYGKGTSEAHMLSIVTGKSTGEFQGEYLHLMSSVMECKIFFKIYMMSQLPHSDRICLLKQTQD